ncbi:MFS transporter [Streptomyces enissocaesilis]|uniref:MFS transporter n=1 Tax=Streptomyces enissocaesilis TaxID=332589 RepID=UPI0031DF9A55
MSFLGRLPTAMCQPGSLLVAETSGSLTTASLVGGALAAGRTAGGPLLGRVADRHGQRTVVLTAALVDAVAVTALVIAALGRVGTLPLALVGALAGASVSQVGPMARTRSVALARRSGADERLVGAVLSFEGTLDEASFVLGPALVGLAAALAHPAAALLVAAALLAVCGTWASDGVPGTLRVPHGIHRTHEPARRGVRAAHRDGAPGRHVRRVPGRHHRAHRAARPAGAGRARLRGHGRHERGRGARRGSGTGQDHPDGPPARRRAATAALVVLSVPLLSVESLGRCTPSSWSSASRTPRT